MCSFRPSVSFGSRLVLAVGAAAVVILSSPFIGDIRSALLAAFPAQFQLIVGGAIATAVVLALLAALFRIRDRWRWRLTGLALAIGGAVAYARLVATGNLLVDVVEHVHFVEYGGVAWLFYRAWRPTDDGRAIAWPLLCGALVGIVDESVQWFIPSRVGEMHDVLLNFVAVSCGVCFAASVDPPFRFRIEPRRQILRPLAYGVSTLVVAFAAFFQVVHMGYQFFEPGMGMFWSQYDGAGLESAAADRSARWRVAPPVGVPRLSREDHYLSEGLWHVQERNRASGAGDVFTAWRENMILERFFAPVLDTSSDASRAPSRWPMAQRDATAARVGDDPGIYISRAAPYPIYTWSPIALWSVVALVVAALITAC